MLVMNDLVQCFSFIYLEKFFRDLFGDPDLVHRVPKRGEGDDAYPFWNFKELLEFCFIESCDPTSS